MPTNERQVYFNGNRKWPCRGNPPSTLPCNESGNVSKVVGQCLKNSKPSLKKKNVETVFEIFGNRMNGSVKWNWTAFSPKTYSSHCLWAQTEILSLNINYSSLLFFFLVGRHHLRLLAACRECSLVIVQHLELRCKKSLTS